jgi:hypothetical protein
MVKAADRYSFDMIGIADALGNATDPWIVATMRIVTGASILTRASLHISERRTRHGRAGGQVSLYGARSCGRE